MLGDYQHWGGGNMMWGGISSSQPYVRLHLGQESSQLTSQTFSHRIGTISFGKMLPDKSV